MIIVDKSAEKKHSHRFLFSKIIKLKIPKPNKYKSSQEPLSFHYGGKRELTLLQKMAINKMIGKAQWPIQQPYKDKQPRYSKLHRSIYRSIDRSTTNREIRMRPIGINRLPNNYTTKTIQCETKEERNQAVQNKRSESVPYLFSGEYSSARFFSKSVEKQKTALKKEYVQSAYQNGMENDKEYSQKIFPFIKKVGTFQRKFNGKKMKNGNFSFRKLQSIDRQSHRADKQCEIRGWQGDLSFREEEQAQNKILAKYGDF